MLKVLGLVVLGVGVVVALAAGAIYALSEMRLNQKVDVPTESVGGHRQVKGWCVRLAAR